MLPSEMGLTAQGLEWVQKQEDSCLVKMSKGGAEHTN